MTTSLLLIMRLKKYQLLGTDKEAKNASITCACSLTTTAAFTLLPQLALLGFPFSSFLFSFTPREDFKIVVVGTENVCSPAMDMDIHCSGHVITEAFIVYNSNAKISYISDILFR